MSAPTDQLRKHLVADESIVDASTGTLLEDTARTEGTIGVTDRRLLFVSDDTGFTDVRYGQICSIRSRLRERLTHRGLGARLLAVSSVLLAALALIVQVVLTPTAFGSLLAVTAVGGFVVAEAVRRTGVEIDRAALGDALRDLDYAFGDGAIRQEWGTEYVYVRQFLLVGGGLLGVLSTVGLAVVAGSPLVSALTFVALGGLAGADYAVRRIRRLDRLGESRRTERYVTVRLVGGHDVTVRLDAAERLGRSLSRSATANTPEIRHDRTPADPGLSRL